MMEDDVEQEQQISPTDQLPAVRYYGLLLFIACALGLLIAAFISSLGT